MKSYSYPRVVTSVTALPHSNARPAAEDTVIYFTPIISTTGPACELVKIHSLEEFRSIFGIDERLGLTLLNISNWLTAGGTLYTYRVVALKSKYTLKSGDTGYNAEAAAAAEAKVAKKAKIELKYQASSDASATPEVVFSAESKYYGSALNGYILKVILLDTKKGIQYILYNKDGVVVERKILMFKEAFSTDSTENSKKEVFDIESTSEYLSSITVTRCTKTTGTGDNAVTVIKLQSTKITTNGDNESVEADAVDYIDKEFANGSDGYSDFNDALSDFWNSPDVVKNRLETPIDIIMDAGYPLDVKQKMIEFISKTDSTTDDVSADRPDINGYFDLGNLTSSDLTAKSEEGIRTALFSSSSCYKKTSNVFFFDQKLTISEEAYFDKDMDVYPSYFLSSLIPTVELSEGIQFPVAGTRRGELVGVKKLSSNPTPDEKEELFKARINYIEKDSRGYYFMSQRTFDGSTDDSYTALSFINNARVTCRMVHELERLGRDYLFEFNDAITLANMSSVMNRYVSNWIANRTLSFGNVVVSADPYSDEKVSAVLNIKFTNTIEVISIDLILQ